jgi:hypothetical protein
MTDVQKIQKVLEQYQVGKTVHGQATYPNSVTSKYNLFARQYYSGSDVSISFNNIPVEEIVEISFGLTQQTQAIFGYGSFTWDAVAYGSRYVEGSFRINFKETFYIRSVLDQLVRDTTVATVDNDYQNILAAQDLTLDELRAKLNSLDQAAIQSLANAYEAKLWSKDQLLNKSEDTAWLDTHGGYDYKRTNGQWGSQYNDLLKYGFDIIIAFGDKIYELDRNPAAAGQSSANTTAKVLNDVHINGYRTVCRPDGQPIFEEYTFVARDMDDSLSCSGTLT